MNSNQKWVEFSIEVLRVIKDKGEDFDDVRHVVHYFYGGDCEGLSFALRELNYLVRPTANEDGIIAERQEAIGEQWRTSIVQALCDLADNYGVEYDGWEASMTRQEQAAPSVGNPLKSLISKLFYKKI